MVEAVQVTDFNFDVSLFYDPLQTHMGYEKWIKHQQERESLLKIEARPDFKKDGNISFYTDGYGVELLMKMADLQTIHEVYLDDSYDSDLYHNVEPNEIGSDSDKSFELFV